MLFTKRIFFSLLGAGVGFLAIQGCKPDKFEAEPLASFAVTNAVPGDTVHVTLDGRLHTATTIVPGNTSISQAGVSTVYLPSRPGGRSIGISRDTGKTNIVIVNANLDAGTISSFFVVGLPTARSIVRLNDNLSLPAAGVVKVRAIHAAAGATTQPVDITFARGTTDSVTISNRAFLSAANATVSEAFIQIPVTVGTTSDATAYTIRVKAAGTGNVLLTVNATLGGAFSTPQNKIYTVVVRGGTTTPALPLSAAVVRNY